MERPADLLTLERAAAWDLGGGWALLPESRVPTPIFYLLLLTSAESLSYCELLDDGSRAWSLLHSCSASYAFTSFILK